MAIIIQPVDDPPAGQDWQFAIPGMYLFDVVTVQATLTTPSGIPTTAHDSSPSSNDGTYHVGGITFGAPGLVGGDTAIQTNFMPSPSVTVPPIAGFANVDDLWFNFWQEGDAGFGNSQFGVDLRTASQAITFHVDHNGAHTNVFLVLTWHIPGGQAFVSVPCDAGPHMFTAVVHRGSGGSGADVDFYIDGVQVGGTQHTTQDGPPDDWTVPGFLCFGDTGAVTWDEVAFGTGAPSGADVATLFAAASVDFATYTVAQLALGTAVKGYYHLDDGASTGRTPGLTVSDGTHLTANIPDGFAAQTTGGPYLYSWQTKLSSSSRTPDGLITSVAIPELILPGGYVVGTRTPDIQSGDQWSNIGIWWDDALQAATLGLKAIDYPPGAFLIIVPQGANA